MGKAFFTWFSSVDIEKLWDIWSSRVLVALVIIAIADYWQRREQRQQHPQRAAPDVAPVLNYDEPLATVTTNATTAPSTAPSNPLLDQLDQQREKQESAISDASDETMPKITKSTESNPVSQPSATRTVTPSSTSTSTATATPSPSIAAKTNHHPGMQGFGYWYETETSLYRIYTLGRHDGVQVAPPYIPHSYRGKVPINLHVTNQTNSVLNVYWVDYKGKHILKGTMRPNHAWTQLTWIDHPWVFEGLDANDNPTPYLYYIPYRVIPTLPECPTVTPDDPNTGLHKFAILPAKPNSPFHIRVHDDVLPFPAVVNFTTPLQGITWTLQHMSRLPWSGNDPSLDLLQRYLSNIVNSPETTKYRQLRIGSRTFGSLWNSPLQGLLLAVGFVEVQGYAELGCSEKTLSRDRIQDLALLSYLLAQWGTNEQKRAAAAGAALPEQPEGADGFGRAGFGRVGGMN
jgi:hypothetical protein